MRSGLFIGILLAAFASTAVCAQSPGPDRLQRILDSGCLRVGTTMDTPVFSMRGADGQLTGFDMDALATLGPALGVKIDYVKTTFGSMLGDLAADTFDMAMSGMGRTFDRARTAPQPGTQDRRQQGRRDGLLHEDHVEARSAGPFRSNGAGTRRSACRQS